MAEMKIDLRMMATAKLEAWGNWARGGIDIGYPKNSVMPERAGGIPIAPMDDEEGLFIDKIILAIGCRDSDAFEFALAHYKNKIPIYKTRFGKNYGADLNAYLVETVARSVFGAQLEGTE